MSRLTLEFIKKKIFDQIIQNEFRIFNKKINNLKVYKLFFVDIWLWCINLLKTPVVTH